MSILTLDGWQRIPVVRSWWMCPNLRHCHRPTGTVLILGIVDIAGDSDGETFSGTHIDALGGTARRCKKELRFATNVTHVISKRVMAKAQGIGRGIALKDLRGIRTRTTVRKAQRRRQHGWAIHQLPSCIEYTTRLAGACDPGRPAQYFAPVSALGIDPKMQSS